MTYWAAEASSQSKPIEDLRAYIKVGEKAPFDGVLLTRTALAKLLTKLDQTNFIAQLDIDKTKKDCDSKAEIVKAVNQAAVDLEKKKTDLCDEDLKRQQSVCLKATETPWYKNPFVAFLAGNIVAGGVCAAASRIK